MLTHAVSQLENAPKSFTIPLKALKGFGVAIPEFNRQAINMYILYKYFWFCFVEFSKTEVH